MLTQKHCLLVPDFLNDFNGVIQFYVLKHCKILWTEKLGIKFCVTQNKLCFAFKIFHTIMNA